MKKSTLIALLLITVLPAFSEAKKRVREKKIAGPVISRITIHGTDIFDFDTKTYLNKFPYSTINLLHIQTKEHIIEQELLFKVGDPVDDFLLQETERNLRALSFNQAARIAKFPQRDGTVAIVVFFSDAWTTEPRLNVGGQNKVNEIEFGFKEKNLFGLGKQVDVAYTKSANFIERSINYTDKRLFGSRWQLEAERVNKTGGQSQTFSVGRPYFSADTPWAASATHSDAREVFPFFDNNVKVSEFEQTKEINEAGASLKVGHGRKIVNHAGLRYRKERARFEPTEQSDLTQPIPENQELHTFFLDLETLKTNYIAITHIEKMTRVEDINLGPRVFASPGYSPQKLNKGGDTDSLSGGIEQKFLVNGTHLFTSELDYSGREVTRSAVNNRYNAELRYYIRKHDFQTVLLHTRLEWGHDLDPDNRIVLGGDNGLRAYKADQFNGNKSFLFNIEDRLYLVDDFANLVSIGAVGFYDMGYAWAEGHPVALSDMRNSIGAGLRFGLTKSSNEVIVRFDISYRLRTAPGEDTRWVFTFGSGQAF